jgi:YHS domain-containing protein
MFGNSLRPFRLFILAIFLIFTLNSLVWAESAVKALDKDSFGLAIKGYDSVAYFTEGKAVKGKEKYSFSWNEALWYFSSAEHRELFAANPKKYAPNRGGW